MSEPKLKLYDQCFIAGAWEAAHHNMKSCLSGTMETCLNEIAEDGKDDEERKSLNAPAAWSHFKRSKRILGFL